MALSNAYLIDLMARVEARNPNDKQFLIDVISQCLPYIGYPRSLNALTCVNSAAKQFELN